MHEEWTSQDTSDFLNLAVCNWALKEVTRPHFDYLAKPPKLQIIFIFCCALNGKCSSLYTNWIPLGPKTFG